MRMGLSSVNALKCARSAGRCQGSGHWSALGYWSGENVWAIDSGCLWGGTLTALRLDREPLEPIQIDCAGYLQPGRD
jgi:hypothetical protein